MDEEKILKAIDDGLADNKEALMSDLEKQAEKLEAVEEKLLNQIDEQAKLRGEVDEEVKAQLTNVQEAITGLKERQDAFEKKAGRFGGATPSDNFRTSLIKQMEDNRDKFEAMKNERLRDFTMKLDGTGRTIQTKATMTQAADWTGDIVEPTRVPGVFYDPERRIRVRQFLPQGTTESNAIGYVEETAIADNTATVAEGDNIPENDLDIELKTASVVKIASTFRIGRESLEDYSALQSHIALRGTERYMNEEDDQILYGDGTGSNLDGLTTTATDYVLDQYTGDGNAQELDVILEAAKQLQDANYQPTAAMISVSRYFDMVRRKDTDGNYIMPWPIVTGNEVPRVAGMPIIAINALNDDDFLVADFPMLTTLFDRRGMMVRFFEQDRDNVQKDLITVQITGRLALPTYLPNAGRYGDFANAIQNAGNS